ncbi:hypothetical protein ABIA39_008687 [Nocardia sp. GAS34]
MSEKLEFAAKKDAVDTRKLARQLLPQVSRTLI